MLDPSEQLEDAVDVLFQVEQLRKIEPGNVQETLGPVVARLAIDERIKPKVLTDAVCAAEYVFEAVKMSHNLGNELVLKPVTHHVMLLN
jgi:hypothetical protein